MSRRLLEELEEKLRPLLPAACWGVDEDMLRILIAALPDARIYDFTRAPDGRRFSYVYAREVERARRRLIERADAEDLARMLETAAGPRFALAALAYAGVHSQR